MIPPPEWHVQQKQQHHSAPIRFVLHWQIDVAMIPRNHLVPRLSRLLLSRVMSRGERRLVLGAGFQQHPVWNFVLVPRQCPQSYHCSIVEPCDGMDPVWKIDGWDDDEVMWYEIECVVFLVTKRESERIDD